MDTDLQIVRNMDHVFDYLRAHSHERDGFFTAGAPANYNRPYPQMNTGVWLLRPSTTVHSALVDFVVRPPPRHTYECGKGFQDAAKTFFPFHRRKQRWYTPLPPTYNCNRPLMTPCLEQACTDCASLQEASLQEGAQTPRVYVVHWSGNLKPTSRFLWNSVAGRPVRFIDTINQSDADGNVFAPGQQARGPMHPTQAFALRQWHANYELGLKLSPA